MQTTDSWINKAEFTLDEIVELIKGFQAKAFKGVVSVTFNEALDTQAADTEKLKAISSLKNLESMRGLIMQEKPDLESDRLLQMVPQSEEPLATILRAFTERRAMVPKRGMCVFTSPYNMWKNELNGRTVMMGIPDSLIYLSDVLFVQTAVDKFQIGRLNHQLAEGGSLAHLL